MDYSLSHNTMTFKPNVGSYGYAKLYLSCSQIQLAYSDRMNRGVMIINSGRKESSPSESVVTQFDVPATLTSLLSSAEHSEDGQDSKQQSDCTNEATYLPDLECSTDIANLAESNSDQVVNVCLKSVVDTFKVYLTDIQDSSFELNHLPQALTPVFQQRGNLKLNGGKYIRVKKLGKNTAKGSTSASLELGWSIRGRFNNHCPRTNKRFPSIYYILPWGWRTGS